MSLFFAIFESVGFWCVERIEGCLLQFIEKFVLYLGIEEKKEDRKRKPIYHQPLSPPPPLNGANHVKRDHIIRNALKTFSCNFSCLASNEIRLKRPLQLSAFSVPMACYLWRSSYDGIEKEVREKKNKVI